MNRGTYTLVLRAVAPLLWAHMAWSAWRSHTDWGVLSRERFGHDLTASNVPRADPATDTARQASAERLASVDGHVASVDGRAAFTRSDRPIWVHAVSVGETRAAEPLIRALLARGDNVLLTHTTPTGRKIGRAMFSKALEGGQLRQAWMPYDFPGACQRFLDGHAPRMAILIEREVWPNMVAACRQAGVPVALVSARLSERGQKRSARLGGVLRQAYASLDIVCAQSADDAARLREAGACHVVVTGNLKFDVVLDSQQVARGRVWRDGLARPVIVLVSTREGEDRPFAQALLEKLERDAAGVRPLIVWVPRHSQRFDEVAASLSQAGLRSVRRSVSAAPPDGLTQIYLGDTLGEMAFYLGAANVAVIGGSFAPLGAQNFIEACAAGVPVILGPSVYNFQDAARDALAQGVVTQVDDVTQALDLAWKLSSDQQAQAAFAPQAQAWMAMHVGATRRILDAMACVARG